MKTCVLDIETISCAGAIERAGVDPQAGFPSWPLHELICASILTIETDSAARPNFRIETFSRERFGERGIVASVERAIADAFEVVTFNGRGFDIPVLMARAAVAGEPAPALARLQAQGRYTRSVHVDLLEEVTNHGAAPKVRLLDLCAALSIPVKFDCAGGEVAEMAERHEWRRIGNYCEADVVATWLALQFWRSAERADPRMIEELWTALAGWIATGEPELGHLHPFTKVPGFCGGGAALGAVSFELVGL